MISLCRERDNSEITFGFICINFDVENGSVIHFIIICHSFHVFSHYYDSMPDEIISQDVLVPSPTSHLVGF